MSERFNIEDLVREEFANKEIRPSKDLFAKIDASYKKKKRRRFGFFFLFVLIAAFCAALFSTTYNSQEIAKDNDAKFDEGATANTDIAPNSAAVYGDSTDVNKTVNETVFKENDVLNGTSYNKANIERKSTFANAKTNSNSISKKNIVDVLSGSTNESSTVNPKKEESLKNENSITAENAVVTINDSPIQLQDSTKVLSFDDEKSIDTMATVLEKVDSVAHLSLADSSILATQDSAKEDLAKPSREPLFFVGLAYHFLNIKDLDDLKLEYKTKPSFSAQFGFRYPLFKKRIIPNVALEFSYFQNELHYPFYSGKLGVAPEILQKINFASFSIPIGIDFRAITLGKWSLLLGGGIKYNFLKYYSSYEHGIPYLSGSGVVKGSGFFPDYPYKNYFYGFYAKAEFVLSTRKNKYAVFAAMHQTATLLDMMQGPKNAQVQRTMTMDNIQVGFKFSF